MILELLPTQADLACSHDERMRREAIRSAARAVLKVHGDNPEAVRQVQVALRRFESGDADVQETSRELAAIDSQWQAAVSREMAEARAAVHSVSKLIANVRSICTQWAEQVASHPAILADRDLAEGAALVQSVLTDYANLLDADGEE